MEYLAYGLLSDWPGWARLLFILVTTHLTIASVTIYLHRAQAHRSLELHAIPSHFFRFWLWMTTGMVTREWVAIHRKHHAKVETVDDLHSPQTRGIGKVMKEGAELYRAEAGNEATLEEYGRGTPDDWVERHIYSVHPVFGIGLLLIIYVGLFGPIGLTLWAIQMAWIPIWAAGVINGVGHWRGYRNFDTPIDTSTNIVPWGILIGGEELHNNHHAYPTSAKFSARWYEFDLGWLYIWTLSFLGLARVKNVLPQPRYDRKKDKCDEATLVAIQRLRYNVLRWFDQAARKNRTHGNVDWASLRERLVELWKAESSKGELVQRLQLWHQEAVSSQCAALQELAKRLASLTLGRR